MVDKLGGESTVRNEFLRNKISALEAESITSAMQAVMAAVSSLKARLGARSRPVEVCPRRRIRGINCFTKLSIAWAYKPLL